MALSPGAPCSTPSPPSVLSPSQPPTDRRGQAPLRGLGAAGALAARAPRGGALLLGPGGALRQRGAGGTGGAAGGRRAGGLVEGGRSCDLFEWFWKLARFTLYSSHSECVGFHHPELSIVGHAGLLRGVFRHVAVFGGWGLQIVSC